MREPPSAWIVRKALRGVVEWPERSQQTARRNALEAATALTERRRQRQDVEEFLTHLPRRSGTHRDLPGTDGLREESIG